MTAHDEAEQATPQDTPEGTESPEDAQRRKFREALEKKKQGHHGAGMTSNAGVSAVSGPAVAKRMHRRKSG
ncbi:DUF5302 domain-containing protein [Agrococcus sp. SL85]|uniref:DUF5302 domain-containing protein n=1 Tax=Agrococcus sp. SL85 TaxID=2995141 RepID=UPI00226CE46A|nr:DUF5302 domain-containing protein [Agrococcus sp. SL85]WAC67117.1 DUF5302 domain-containing protein [Agrococcus sp. SL85]